MKINDTGYNAPVKVDMFRKLYFLGAESESGVSWHEIVCTTLHIDTYIGILNDIDIASDIDIGILNDIGTASDIDTDTQVSLSDHHRTNASFQYNVTLHINNTASSDIVT